MRDQLTARLEALRQEALKAEQQEQTLTTQLQQLVALRWRIAGAITVLEESLALPDAPDAGGGS
jgi:hypothetical protein